MLGRQMVPHTFQFVIQVCEYMAPIADNLCMHSTYVMFRVKIWGVRGRLRERFIKQSNFFVSAFV